MVNKINDTNSFKWIISTLKNKKHQEENVIMVQYPLIKKCLLQSFVNTRADIS